MSESDTMSRKELGIVVAGAIGLLAGRALVSPHEANAASSGLNRVNAEPALPWRPTELFLSVGRFSLFSKGKSIDVTSSDPGVCTVHQTSGKFGLHAGGPSLKRGYCTITLRDTATGERDEFLVQVD